LLCGQCANPIISAKIDDDEGDPFEKSFTAQIEIEVVSPPSLMEIFES